MDILMREQSDRINKDEDLETIILVLLSIPKAFAIIWIWVKGAMFKNHAPSFKIFKEIKMSKKLLKIGQSYGTLHDIFSGIEKWNNSTWKYFTTKENFNIFVVQQF